MMLSATWWRDTAERVLATAAETAGASVALAATAVTAGQATWRTLPYEYAATLTALAALASFLKCVAALRVGDPQSASLVSKP